MLDFPPMSSQINGRTPGDNLRIFDEMNFANIFDEYAPTLLGLINDSLGNKKTSEEFLQRIFTAAWLERHMYIQDQETLFTWLQKISRRFLNNKFQEEKLIQNSIDAVHDSSVNIATGIKPEKDSSILYLAYNIGQNLEEIAARRGLTPSEAAKQLRLELKNTQRNK